MLVLNSSSQFQKVTAQIFTGIVRIYSDIYFMKIFLIWKIFTTCRRFRKRRK